MPSDAKSIERGSLMKSSLSLSRRKEQKRKLFDAIIEAKRKKRKVGKKHLTLHLISAKWLSINFATSISRQQCAALSLSSIQLILFSLKAHCTPFTRRRRENAIEIFIFISKLNFCVHVCLCVCLRVLAAADY